MTCFYFNPANLGKLINQNKAELLEFYEGCLQDNALYITKNNGLMAIYEHFKNEWTSDLYIEFSKDPAEKETIYNKFTVKMEAIA